MNKTISPRFTGCYISAIFVLVLDSTLLLVIFGAHVCVGRFSGATAV